MSPNIPKPCKTSRNVLNVQKVSHAQPSPAKHDAIVYFLVYVKKNLVGPILFSYYVESLVFSNLNSKHLAWLARPGWAKPGPNLGLGQTLNEFKGVFGTCGLGLNSFSILFLLTVFLIILYTPIFLLNIRIIINISSHPWFLGTHWFVMTLNKNEAIFFSFFWKNFKMANSKKLSFSTTLKRWAIVAKI